MTQRGPCTPAPASPVPAVCHSAASLPAMVLTLMQASFLLTCLLLHLSPRARGSCSVPAHHPGRAPASTATTGTLGVSSTDLPPAMHSCLLHTRGSVTGLPMAQAALMPIFGVSV